MYIDHHTLIRISQVIEKIRINTLLLDSDGTVLLPQGDTRKLPLPERFLANTKEPYVYGGFTLIGTQTTNPVYLCISGDSVEIASCARLAVAMIEMVMQVDIPHANVEEVFRCVLRKEINGSELESLAQMHGISENIERCVLVMHLRDLDTDIALNILNNITEVEGQEESRRDIIVEMDKYTIALVKTLDDQAEFSDMEQIALAIQNTFYTETSHEVYIGVGEPVHSLVELTQSYSQARKAIDVGRTFRPTQSVYMYRSLLLERFLSDVPQGMAAQYSTAIFNMDNIRLLNDEMLQTIEKFFENNLNLSETARQLYIHRNTLVYRLDKVQKALGLDLRVFDDAVTFKLMMLLGKQQ